MPKINDPEPIIINGKQVYDNELDRIKQMYDFFPPTLNQEQSERISRYHTRQKHKINQAR